MRVFPLAVLAALAMGAGVAHAQDSAVHTRSSTEMTLLDTKAPPPDVPPPHTARHAASSTLHGVVVQDPYRWLENPGDPAVQRWIKAQNGYTEHVIDAMPGNAALSKRVRELAITSTTRSAPEMAGGTLFYMQETPPQPQPVLMAQAWPNGKARALVDLNKDGGGEAITAYWPSPSGRYLAYGTAKGGSELTTIHVLDVKTGKRLDDTLPYAGGGTTPQALAWDADEHGFVYVRFPVPPTGKKVKQFNAELVHHALGSQADTDKVVFGKGYSAVAEYRLLSSPGAKRLAMLANIGDGGAAEVYLRRDGHWSKLLGRRSNVRGAAWVGQRLVLLEYADASRGRLLVREPSGELHVLLKPGKGAVQRVTPMGDGFAVVRSWGPDWWIDQYDDHAKFVRRVPLPKSGIGIGGIAAEHGRDHALISYGGWSLPSRWVDYDTKTGALKTVFEVKPATDAYAKIRVQRVEGVSRDGTHIPVTVLSMPGVTPNGKRPTILYSYGGFDIPIAPRFIGPYMAWLEHGGVLAYANIRGGNEFGESWHAQGQKLHKQNVFDDFYAAGQALKKAKWTDTAHLGIMGGSNGGLLMGAQIVQHPKAYRAVVSMVGIYDMIRHETNFANGKYNVSEYGSVSNAAQFRATLKYSPLQNVKPKTAYPAVLMTTGANDPRVAPWQSRKFTAALQNASDSGQPILLLTRMNAGHGIGAPFAQRVGNTALALSFFAGELGLDVH
ncbi:prolyl oligopeptidase family serine peptidase [Oleiagrimonas sp. MCCC 1A03011]|uniref:prolyl oligopeptidase family serine peptidase n=1 Tax=Oleiagrimonas sp. MCCC 1A03011 TaxID=1926883 RepID=UPI000DC51F24|nr:prolyl oligopeptidase family serine peptidase [Oleiagrimonas sp. MCCC 1A03011]RAP56932.1 peptidase S9 [Oleiagrimonas sp. MCCC 1A03011]